MRVLITGASGFVGSRLVPALLDEGHEVVALVRDQKRYDPPAGVTVTQGDLLDVGGFERALSGIDATYYLVHSMRTDGSFTEHDRRAARNFVRAAEGTELDRVIYLSGLGRHDGRLSDHLRSRREVERILDTGDYDLTTLRAAIIVGDGSAGYEIIRRLATLPVLVAPSGIDTRCQPIAIDDAIEYLTGVLSVPETRDDTFEIGGPDVLTYKEMLVRIGRATRDQTPLIVTVPVDPSLVPGHGVALLTGVSQRVTTPLLGGLNNPVVVTDTRIQSLVPIERTPFERALERTLSPENGARNQHK